MRQTTLRVGPQLVDLQGLLPLDPPPGPPFACFLQPKCVVVYDPKRDAMVLELPAGSRLTA